MLVWRVVGLLCPENIEWFIEVHALSLSYDLAYPPPPLASPVSLKVHKIEIFFGFDFEICIISYVKI